VGSVALGPAASVWYGSVLRADEDEIIVGADCNIQDLCCLHVDPGEPVVLADGSASGTARSGWPERPASRTRASRCRPERTPGS
jgi:hypothetical protein